MAKKIQYYVSMMGQYKQIEHGYALDNEMAYSKLDGEFTITHLKTGLRVASGKTLKAAKEIAKKLFAERGEIAKKNIAKYDVEKLPLKEDFVSWQIELEQLLDLRSFPVDVAYSSLTGKYMLDIIKLDEILMKRKGYNHELSMKENVLNMYGERAVELIEKF